MALPTLIVMVKEPRAGQVKTRLGREVGMTTSAWWFRHQTGRLLRRLYAPRRWTMILAVAPDCSGLKTRVWPAYLPRVAQGKGDLGARMFRLLKNHRSGPVCLIGGDIPGILPTHIAHAFAKLGAQDMVFGPAEDGGFWLVGANGRAALPPRLFQSVRWSTKHALSDSLETLQGKRVTFVETLQDIDTAEDLARFNRS